MRQEKHLAPREANFRPLTPLDFLERTVSIYPDRAAVIWHDQRYSYREFADLVGRFAAMLRRNGIGVGDTVSIMAPNRPEMLASHYAVPMVGAVLNTINTRLDADTVGYILKHSESKVLLVDPSCADTAKRAAAGLDVVLVRIDGGGGAGAEESFEALVEHENPDPISTSAVTDEWQPICLNYTSGTTGRPKGVVYHHRGAYLNALGNILSLGLTTSSIYLWTLPMFHCNGWCHTWAVTAAGGTHVCLDRVEPSLVFRAIEAHGVTHLSCAPVVLYMLLNHPDRSLRDPSRRVLLATGGASPTSALIRQLDAIGFDLVHLYGLTESYGPATLCMLRDDWGLTSDEEKARALARQGVRHITANCVRVVDQQGDDVPSDGVAVGEVVLKGNTLLAGYYGDEAATQTAFAGGEFHTGDLAVRHPDGYIEIKDRAKDIIISGGENISSLEVESVLHQHPAVLLAAVVAVPDEKWGETPCAVIELKDGMTATPEELTAFCRTRLAGFKVPRMFVFQAIPKTATGKVQKFQLRAELRASDRS
ncbi:AMP-binding protein [Microvirga makkahensis]|uniref:3-methylmercaptopropionyl-CoA ligase n=1 Tax=Microvirga makkahensis TaxID=1128670 RepID=A0A7X3MX79_9HYPH|nr:AMP-binding protein [Microvirga makkahensis]MXQ14859.1 AMP-binding protein [Microvirga makkahensis]